MSEPATARKPLRGEVLPEIEMVLTRRADYENGSLPDVIQNLNDGRHAHVWAYGIAQYELGEAVILQLVTEADAAKRRSEVFNQADNGCWVWDLIWQRREGEEEVRLCFRRHGFKPSQNLVHPRTGERLSEPSKNGAPQ